MRPPPSVTFRYLELKVKLWLPKKHTIKPHNVREGRVESDGSLQLSFFQLEDPLLSSLKEELERADLNNMTPLQAFDLLRNMKDQLGI